MPSGEYEIAMLGLNFIDENNSNDFIISWDTINTQYLKISGDSINFSKLERENPPLAEAMLWARRLVGLSLLIIFGRNCWNTLLNMLGVGTQIYAKENEEQDKINKAEQTRVKKEEREIAKRRNQQRRIYYKKFKKQQTKYKRGG